MSNRSELESRIAELQAAVNGLTEELVETKERVRILETEVDEQRAAAEAAEETAEQPIVETDTEAEPAVREWTTKSDDHVEVVKHERNEPAQTDEETDNSATETVTDADKSDESQDADSDASAEESDIIVA
ncbi:DUF7518 family protein [Natronocalculus amylovorans]|uniref:BZIP transcription factor n=1 Tax=Natronocalculus amylovorans TaxID=2917812 RepID=A0AAE3FV43_9EURY|nr:bZIP transcription factor [Natronocalculus amylovorans]MCL9815510.1 bZIP transcription factor [Natronocalculus amylovorans]